MKTQPTPEEITRYLNEDVGGGDLTAQIIPPDQQAEAQVICRQPAVLCGQAWFDAVFHHLDPNIRIDWRIAEAAFIPADTLICTVKGPARALLTGERTALNLLQTLSATATESKRYADAVADTACKILDTRKTIPGLRMAQKYAVSCGGCLNHRIGLFDAVLIKENHILAAGSIAQAIKKARQIADVLVEIEVENLAEFDEALQAHPDRIMLDNFSLDDLNTAVKQNAGQVELEASGNITLANIGQIAQTGVDFISIGALTKNIHAIDLSMRIRMENHE